MPRKTIPLNELASEQVYEKARSIQVRHWTKLLAAVRSLQPLKGETPPDLEAAVLDQIRCVMANLALWSVTEISPHPSWKYGAQPLKTQKAKKQLQDARRNKERFDGLRHEHVVERAGLVSRLIGATTDEDVETVLMSSLSCVVTKDQDAMLREATKGRKKDQHRYAHLEDEAALYAEITRRLE